MAQSKATTVAAYFAELSKERREIVSAVRDVVRRNLPEGYVEQMDYGMITYAVPLATFPKTYNGKPLMYAALAAQKNYFSLYLSCRDEQSSSHKKLVDGFARAGLKLDMGKSCIRFKKLEDLPLDVIAEAIAATPVKRFVAQYERSQTK